MWLSISFYFFFPVHFRFRLSFTSLQKGLTLSLLLQLLYYKNEKVSIKTKHIFSIQHLHYILNTKWLHPYGKVLTDVLGFSQVWIHFTFSGSLYLFSSKGFFSLKVHVYRFNKKSFTAENHKWEGKWVLLSHLSVDLSIDLGEPIMSMTYSYD